MDILTISTIDMARLKNAEHVQLHSNVRNLVTTATPTKLGLADVVFTPYRDAILAEQDIVNKATGSAYTLEMQEADQKRDQIFKRVRKKLELCELEDESTTAFKATGVVKKHLLAKYPGSVCQLPYQEESATLAGFVLDCRELLTDEQVEGIGIDSDLDDLESANIKFGRMYQERVGERAEGDTRLSLKLRAATDQAYQVLTLSLNALANDPTPANATQVAAVRELVGKMNVVIKEAKDRLNQRMAPSDSPQEGGNEVSNTAPSDSPQGGENGGSNSSNPGSNTSSSGGSNSSNPSNPDTGSNIIVDGGGDNYE